MKSKLADILTSGALPLVTMLVFATPAAAVDWPQEITANEGTIVIY